LVYVTDAASTFAGWPNRLLKNSGERTYRAWTWRGSVIAQAERARRKAHGGGPAVDSHARP
jgi:hypothetical protein